MDGSKPLSPQQPGTYSSSSDADGSSPVEGRSGNKKVVPQEATSYLPRGWLFGNNPISSPYRYRKAALPPSGEMKGSERKLPKETAIHLDQLKTALKITKNHLAILSGNHFLYNWLILQARQIEEDLSSSVPQKISNARNLAACIDGICKAKSFDWRNMTLGLNYPNLDTKKEQEKAELLFKDDAEEKAFQLSDTHVFSPPWSDKILGQFPMAQIYDAYWEIRQRLGAKDSPVPFHKEEFAALFSPIVQWLQDFEALAKAHPDITPQHIAAFKYLLDDCDSYPNSVEDQPVWTWKDLINIQNPKDCTASKEIKEVIRNDERLLEIDAQINDEDSSVFSLSTHSPEPETIDDDPGELSISIPRSKLSEKSQPELESDSTVSTGSLFADDTEISSDSENDMEVKTSRDTSREPSLLSPVPERKRALEGTPEPEETKRFRELSPSPEPSLASSEVLSSIPSQESSLESRPTRPAEIYQWKKEREELLSLNPQFRFSHSGTGFGKWFPDTLDSLKYNPEPTSDEAAPRVGHQDNGKLDLDTYDFIALPMMCVKELLADYDNYKTSDEQFKEVPTLWIRPRLATMRKIFKAIDDRFDELKSLPEKKLAAMEISETKLRYGSQIYNDYCTIIDKIREQYIKCNETVKAFSSAIGTDGEDEARKQLVKTMSQPDGWVLKALMSDSEWQSLLDESNNPDT